MVRYLLAVALLVAASCVSVVAGEPAMKADAAYGVVYAKEQVVALPQDQETPYLTLFGDRNDAKFNEIVGWFSTNETLVGIKGQTHFNVIYSDDAMYRERYAATVPALPCVRLQAVNEDQPVAEYAGVNVPLSADALARGLNTTASKAACFRRHQRCQPQPQPVPTPLRPDPTPQPLPPAPQPAPKSHNVTWLLLTVLAIGGGVCGAAKHLKDVYHGRKV